MRKTTLNLADITTGKRVRRDYGELDSLAESIDRVGLLQPVVVDDDYRLIAGARRIGAVRKLGWEAIDAVIVSDLDDALPRLVAERDENTCRKDFTASEAVALGERMEELERKAAKERQAHGDTAPGRNASGKLPEASKGDTRDKVGAAVGMSGRQYEKAKAVVATGDADLIETMDTKGVETAMREMKEREREKERKANARKVEKAPSVRELVGSQLFSTIVIDPPWDWGDEGDVDQLGRATPLYETWPIERLIAEPVAEMAAPDAHLYLWITNRSLPKGFELLDAWGFRYVTCITWAKPSFGMGNYFRGQTEHILFGVRGSLMLKRKDVGTLFSAPRPKRKHSAKPPEFLGLVESCSPGPYLEMFARGERDGWTHWGEDS